MVQARNGHFYPACLSNSGHCSFPRMISLWFWLMYFSGMAAKIACFQAQRPLATYAAYLWHSLFFLLPKWKRFSTLLISVNVYENAVQIKMKNTAEFLRKRGSWWATDFAEREKGEFRNQEIDLSSGLWDYGQADLEASPTKCVHVCMHVCVCVCIKLYQFWCILKTMQNAATRRH